MTNPRVDKDTYDRKIVPAETAARIEREGNTYKQTPETENPDSVDTAGGYTVDQEGLMNNYAVEPEMYYEVPGDAAQKEMEEERARAEELHDINDNDETGKLGEGYDDRGKGSGII